MKGRYGGKTEKILALGAAGVILFCLALFFACQRGTRRQMEGKEEPVTLTLVYAYQNAQWNQGIATIVEEFSKSREDITMDVRVQYEDKVYEDILSKLQARGQMGDIIQLKAPGRYAEEGLLAPIPPKLAALLDETYAYDGQAYGLLALGNTNGVLYNQDIFEAHGLKEPRDYGEFLTLCRTLDQAGVTPVGVAGGDLWHLEFWVNHFFRNDVLRENENWLRDKNAGTVSWQDEEPLEMLDHLKQLLSSGSVNSDWALKQDGSLTYAMSQGEVAMIYTGSWNARELKKLNPEISLGWFFVPDEAGRVIVSENKDAFWCITKECGGDQRRYQAAQDFLEFFYTSEAYNQLCINTCGYPVTVEKTMVPGEELQIEIQKEVSRYRDHMSLYIGNEDTPQGFETALLTGIIDLGEGRIDTRKLAEQLDALWEQYQEQER